MGGASGKTKMQDEVRPRGKSRSAKA